MSNNRDNLSIYICLILFGCSLLITINQLDSVEKDLAKLRLQLRGLGSE